MRAFHRPLINALFAAAFCLLLLGCSAGTPVANGGGTTPGDGSAHRGASSSPGGGSGHAGGSGQGGGSAQGGGSGQGDGSGQGGGSAQGAGGPVQSGGGSGQGGGAAGAPITIPDIIIQEGLNVFSVKSQIESAAISQCGSLCVTVTVDTSVSECLQNYTSSPPVRLTDPNDPTSDYLVSRGTAIHLIGGDPCTNSGGSSSDSGGSSSAPGGSSSAPGGSSSAPGGSSSAPEPGGSSSAPATSSQPSSGSTS